MSPLHVIVVPLRLLGLIIVAVALMKESWIKVISPTTDEESSVRVRLVPTELTLRKVNDSESVLVLISQIRNPISLVHQNTAESSEHSSPLSLTRTNLPIREINKNYWA